MRRFVKREVTFRTTTARNEMGWEIQHLRFESQDDLEAYFISLIGDPALKGKSSKAIGNTLLIWDRNQKPAETSADVAAVGG